MHPIPKKALIIVTAMVILFPTSAFGQSVQDFERAAIEKLRRERAASAKAQALQRAIEARANAMQRAAASRMQAEQRAAKERLLEAERRRKAEIARAAAERKKKALIERAAIAQEIDTLKNDAVSGNMQAALDLATRYAKGLRADQSTKEAVKWFKVAADSGNAQAQLEMARYIQSGEVPDLGVQDEIKYLTGSAKGGNSVAKFLLAERLYAGNGLAQDQLSSISLYRESADLGNLDAAARLGEEYQKGTLVKRDYRKANSLLFKSTNNVSIPSGYPIKNFSGSLIGLYALGNAYAGGLGIKRNKNKAYLIFKALSNVKFRDSIARAQVIDPFYYPEKSNYKSSTTLLEMQCGDDFVYVRNELLYWGPLNNSYLKEEGRHTYLIRNIFHNIIYDFESKKARFLGTTINCK